MHVAYLAEVVRPHGLLLVALAVGSGWSAGCSSDGNGAGAAGQPATAGTAGVGGGTTTGGSAGSGAAAGGGGNGGVAGGSGSGGLGGAAGDGGEAGASAGPECTASMVDADQPELLSATGCVDMVDFTQPAPGLVPYRVNSALWSDGAVKHRFLKLPPGGKIHVLDCAVEPDECKAIGLGGSGADEGHWGMPVGTVLVKNFSVGGKRIETRLFMRRTARVWKGFSYEWNEAETEATLLGDEAALADGKDRQLTDQVWHYPGRGQCLDCHTDPAGRSLGPTTAQMKGDFPYADGTMDQIAKFEQLGLFDAPPKAIPAYPDPYGAVGTLEQRARSYLHTNCAICHRPGGEFSTVDMRFVTDLADMSLCNADSERDTGLVPAKRLVPTKPAESSLSFRMHETSVLRMPKIGSSVVDGPGAALIDAWITGITACP